MLDRFGIEIGGGLGNLAGRIWRVGLMGHACCPYNVFLFLSAFETVLKTEGIKVKPVALSAAAEVYDIKWLNSACSKN
ncbi:MAG: hypothetical protein ACLQVM_09080 [Terriglobia bacterium]